MPQQETVLVTPEEIIHLILEEMQAGMCPSYYSNLAPSVFDVYLYIDDFERLRPLERRMRDEAVRALDEKLRELNKSVEPRIKAPFLPNKKTAKRYEILGQWSVEFHENTDDDARDNPLVIHSAFPAGAVDEERAGTMTERVMKRRSDGQSIVTSTERSAEALDTSRATGILHANIEYEDDTGAHVYQMTKDLIKIGRGAADRWVDLKVNAKKDVSREHLQIRRDPASGQFFIKDLSSLGTTVNGKRIPASIEHVNGEEVDKNLEAPLPPKARIGLAGVLSLDFKAVKH